MDEIFGAIFAPLAAIFALVLATLLLPFVLLGQLVYNLMRPKDQRREISWERKSVFRHFADDLYQAIVVYGFAGLAILGIFAGTAIGISMTEEEPPVVQAEEEDGLLKKAVTAGGKATLAEAEERGWLDRFRKDDAAEAVPEEPVTGAEETAEKKPFWKVWD